MIDSHVMETIRDKAIITSEFIRVNETSALHLFASHRDESLTGDILNNFHPDFSSALQDAERRDIPGSPATTVSLSSPAKIRLIHLNLPEKSE
ncbi:MAG: hypothetical protein WCF90_00035 [Methanomicrobiales archaeon]